MVDRDLLVLSQKKKLTRKRTANPISADMFLAEEKCTGGPRGQRPGKVGYPWLTILFVDLHSAQVVSKVQR